MEARKLLNELKGRTPLPKKKNNNEGRKKEVITHEDQAETHLHYMPPHIESTVVDSLS